MMQASVSIDSLASNPRSSKFDVDHRNQQLIYLQQALDSTSPPADDPDTFNESVPTSISMAGPGNYGTKEIENGEEVVLLNDDVLTSVANATVVIIDGNDLERITVLYQFPQFLEHCPQESINVMVPRICLEAVNWSDEAQIAAAEALFFVVNVKVPYRVANQVACSTLQITSDVDNMQVFDACGEIVSTILPQVHRYDVLQNIVPEAIDRAVSIHAPQRRLAARIIGSINHALEASELDAIFAKTALNLSSDSDESVRALTAQSLASIGSKVPLSVSERYLWPRLRDLILHDTATVKAAALRALAKSAEAHRSHCLNCDSFNTLMKPIFIHECQRAADVAASDLRVVSDDTYLILEVFSEIYGHFMCALAPLLTRDKLWGTTLTALRLMVTCNGPTVRHWCAFNMPAVAALCADDKSAHVTGVIPSLAGDSDLETRSTLAAGIHELTKSLRKGALRNDVIRAVGMLFMDENAQVRMNALGHFSQLLYLLSSPETNTATTSMSISVNGGHSKKPSNDDDIMMGSGEMIRVSDDVVIRFGSRVLASDGTDEEEMRRLAPMFSSLELMSFDSWRTQKLLAEEVEKSAHLIPQEMLCEHVAPLLFQMARESTFLVRKASMRSLIHVLRYVPDVRRRNHILRHFKMEWAHGKVYWTRLAFVDATECALKLFSLRLFTALFKDEVLALKKDKVVNVRLRLLRFLRDVAAVWKHLPEFTAAIDDLCTDGDWQVSVEARDLRDNLEQSINGNGGDDGFELTRKELELDAEKERAETRFFKHKQKKRKAKSRGMNNNNNNSNNNINNTSKTTTPSNQTQYQQQQQQQNDQNVSVGGGDSTVQSEGYISTTADDIIGDLDSATSTELKQHQQQQQQQQNGHDGLVGIQSGRLRTRSVIDSNGMNNSNHVNSANRHNNNKNNNRNNNNNNNNAHAHVQASMEAARREASNNNESDVAIAVAVTGDVDINNNNRKKNRDGQANNNMRTSSTSAGSNNSALADESPKKSNPNRQRNNTEHDDNEKKQGKGTSTTVAGALTQSQGKELVKDGHQHRNQQRQQQEEAFRPRQPTTEKKSILQLICGCFGGGG